MYESQRDRGEGVTYRFFHAIQVKSVKIFMKNIRNPKKFESLYGFYSWGLAKCSRLYTIGQGDFKKFKNLSTWFMDALLRDSSSSYFNIS